MDRQAEEALKKDLVIDITTKGRKTGQPRRVEIWFHNLDGRLYITGPPGRRHWLASRVTNPHFTFHFKESAQADLPARARPIFEEQERRDVLTTIVNKLGNESGLEERLNSAPLIQVELQTS